MSGTDLPEALVLVAHGSHGVIRTSDGPPQNCKFRRAVGRPCCGDRVRVATVDAESVAAESILPRRNEFVRADQRGRKQVVAANVDRALVVIAPRPAPSEDLLDRYLVAVRSLGIEPLIVLNKSDLLEEAPQPSGSPISRLDGYAALGYQVVHCSTRTVGGLAALEPLIAHGTSILVGQSGVGKSSLVQALIPDLELQIGELSRVTGKGTHTTTTTMLYDLPSRLGGQGSLIDSPGVWEYGLWRLEQRELEAGYPEFSPVLGTCRFNDCQHVHEPGCAVIRAAAEGSIPAWRHQSYLRLMEQNPEAPPR